MDPNFIKAKTDLQERIAILPTEIRDLITEGTLDNTSEKIQLDHHFTDEQRILLENEVVLVLTFFVPIEELLPNIKNILDVTDVEAEVVAYTIEEDLILPIEEIFYELSEKLSTEIPTVAKKTDLQKLAEAFAEKSKQAQATTVVSTRMDESDEIKSEQVTPPPTQAPNNKNELRSVEPLRTMEGDINRVHGYGAHHEQLEKEKGEDTHVSSQEKILKHE